MKPLSRRSVTTGLAAAVTAIPAVGLGMNAVPKGNHTLADSGNDPLLEGIGRYRAEVDALNASRNITDEEVDAWTDRADAILIEAVGLPVMTAAGALAVISLFIDDGWTLSQHSIYGDEFEALARAAKNYLASTVT